jgi:hypothetical protein
VLIQAERESEAQAERAANMTHQRGGQPAQEPAEVIAGGGARGIDTVALTTLEMTAIHAMLGREMADDQLEFGPALHPSLRRDRGANVKNLAVSVRWDRGRPFSAVLLPSSRRSAAGLRMLHDGGISRTGIGTAIAAISHETRTDRARRSWGSSKHQIRHRQSQP